MSDRFELKAPVFEGPLETLLDLIESRKLAISGISLAEVCDAYLAYVEKLPELPLKETAQFILVASTLLLIKSRTLLPTLELTSDERESVEELERRLAYYSCLRVAAKQLRTRWGSVPLVLLDHAPARPVVFSPGETSLESVRLAARRILSTLPKPTELVQAAVAPILALEDVIAEVRERLSRAIRTRFSDLVRSSDRHELIVHFLAILELVRTGSASVSQDKLFSDITIELETIGSPRYG